MPFRLAWSALRWVCERERTALFVCGIAFTGMAVLLYLIAPAPLQRLDHALYDTLLRSTFRGPTTGAPVIVDVDDKSLAEFGQWPWPRYLVARLLGRLTALGVAAVGLDIVFPEPDRTSLRTVQQDVRTHLGIDIETRGFPDVLLDNDRTLARALASGRAVLGYQLTFQDGGPPRPDCPLHPIHLAVVQTHGVTDDVPGLRRTSGALCSLPELSEAATASGFFNVVPDVDGVLRRAPLLMEQGGSYYPSLTLATLMRVRGVNQVILTMTPSGANAIRLDHMSIPVDARGDLLIRYRGGRGTFARVSASDVLADRIPSEEMRGKIVFVGASATGFADLQATPADVYMPGAEIHATLADNILKGDFFVRPAWASGIELLLVVVCGLLSGVVLIWMGVLWSLVGLGLGVVGFWYGSLWALQAHGVVLSPLIPWVAWGGDFLVLALLRHRLTQVALVRRTRHLETVRVVSEEIIRELDLTTLLQIILQRSLELSGATAGAILLWDEASRTLSPQVWTRCGEWMREVRIGPGEGLVGLVAEKRAGQVVNGRQDWPLGDPLAVGRPAVAALLAEPLLYRNALVGVIAIAHESLARTFGRADRELITLLAAQASIAVENARLFTVVNQSFLSLQQAQDTLVRNEKLRALGQMAAGIAHDLNNMLAAILGQVDLLRLRVLAPEVSEALSLLETAATDGASIVSRLQDFSRRRTSTALEPLDLAKVVDEAVNITRPFWKDEAQRRGAEISVQIRLAGLPNVLGHAPDLREALTNLILNAVDAMPRGGSLTFAGSAAPERVTLTVTDTGTGMPEDVRRRIFEPFFTTKGVGGTGLGLSVVYGIMERHGGQIDVTTTPGLGTTFSLHFQTGHSEGTVMPKQSPTEVRVRRILLIDDDPAVRMTVANLLRALRQVVFEADSGPAGLAILADQPVEVVFTDLGMPQMTGWEVARRVKAQFPRLPVVLLTGWGDQMCPEAEEGRLVTMVLSKPVRLADLAQALRELDAAPKV